jgi:predicted transcriptional regulator
MNISELKLKLIEKIIHSDDVEFLMKIETFLEQNNDFIVNEPQALYENSAKKIVLNDWQKARIKKAQQQIKNGEFLTFEEDQIEMEKWFQEQEKLL